MNHNKKQKGILLLSLFFISLILAFNHYPIFNDKSVVKIETEIDQVSDNDEFNEPKLSSSEPNGKPLLVQQCANISKVFYGVDSGENVSFTLYDDWISQNTTINYEGITQKRNIVNNSAFDSRDFGWIYKTNIPGTWDQLPWQSDRGFPTEDGCTGIDGSNAGRSTGDYGYFEQNITLPNERFVNDFSTFSLYYYSDWSLGFNGSIFISIIIGGKEINHSVLTQDVSQDSWSPLSLSYNPISFGHVLPGVVTIRAGIIMNEDSSGWLLLYFDQIKFEMWSESNEEGIIKVFDNQFTQNHTYYNTTFGGGYSFMDTERTPDSDNQIDFTVYSNRSGLSDFNIKNITIIAHAIKKFNSTVSNKLGSLYSLGENISWQVEFSLTINNNYYCWVFIEKPSDWEFIHAIDSLEDDKIGFCLGKGLGSKVMKIPFDHISEDLWKLEAISKNYIEKGNIGVWDNSQFNDATSLTYGDKFLVNITIDDTLILSNSEINCTIYYPNASILWQNSKEPTTYNEKFGNFTVGKNMTVGNYLVNIQWVNNPSSKEIDKIGYMELEFIVWHHTSLTAIGSYIERIAGAGCIIRINFTDYDLNTFIPLATITYNSTFGESGEMTYGGSGEYILDLDTSALGLGDYYFSFNASKIYYQNQTANNLVHLKIIAQPLAIEVPSSVISGSGNDYISCQINVTGVYSGTLILEANVSTNWQNPYTVTDHGNGTFTLNFSTWNLPTQGNIETFSVSVFASKEYYGNTTNFIALAIYPIPTIIGVNSSNLVVDLGKSVYVRINYTDTGSGSLILGANCSIIWPSSYNIISDAQGFVVRLDTVNLSIDSYKAKIELEKPGFETVYKSLTVDINRVDIKVNTIDFKDSIETFVGDTITIKINLTEIGTEIYIENASVRFEWEFGSGYFDYVANGIYELELKIPGSDEGNYKMTLWIMKEDSIYKSKEFSFIITIRGKEQTNYIIWYVSFGLLIGISILGILSLRSYVILPFKRRKDAELLAKTQRYKDIMNVEAIVISNRESGIHLYSKNYYLIKDHQNELLSGFIQAITLISNEIVGKERLEEIKIKSDKVKGSEKIIELDFKHFNFFISDYRYVRVVFILKEKASERFKKIIASFLSALDIKFSDKLIKWNGELNEFEKFLPSLINKHFQLYYRDHFRINPALDKSRISKEEEMSKVGKRLLNVIISMTRNQEEFYLEEAIGSIHEKNQDKLIEALEKLIERKILTPSKEQGIL